jgi:hypothetical protein
MVSRVRVAYQLAAAVVSLALGVVVAAGCGGQDPYDTSCKVDDDCVVVPTSPSCDGCDGCGRTTINRGDQDRYNQDLDDADCDDHTPISCGATCEEPFAACSDGACALR